MQIHKRLPIPKRGGVKSPNLDLLNQMDLATEKNGQMIGDAVDLDKRSRVNSLRYSAKRIGCVIKARKVGNLIRCWKMQAKGK